MLGRNQLDNSPVFKGLKHNSVNSDTPSSSDQNKQWVEVLTFKGNGMKKSQVFELKGGSSRLKYKYKAPSGLGMGMFSAYVLKEGVDLMEDGGFPDIMTDQESEESESHLHKKAGRYYLYINASGNWSVSLEEQR